MTVQELAAIAAGLSGIAALGSAVAAWRVPYAVAKYAENSRKQSEDRARKLKLLETMIQHRATIAYPNSVAALNSIPFVFASSKPVREALKRFMAATNEKPIDQGRVVERHLSIISAILRDLGLDDQITTEELDDFYYPELLGRAHAVETMEVMSKSEALQATANNNPLTTG